jgi:GTPase Era involved in 16S rRNA processing
LERHFERKVFLDLSVAIAEGWIDDQRLIAELAHLSEAGEDAVSAAEMPL